MRLMLRGDRRARNGASGDQRQKRCSWTDGARHKASVPVANARPDDSDRGAAGNRNRSERDGLERSKRLLLEQTSPHTVVVPAWFIEIL